MEITEIGSQDKARQALIEKSLNLYPELRDAISAFEQARILVPMPLLGSTEPVRHSTSSN